MVTGHIRKRATKSGKVSYQIILETERDPITGQRQRFYETVNGTKKEAEKRLNQRIHELSNGASIVKTSAVKLKDWMHEWLSLYTAQLAETTRAGYRQQIEYRINPYLGDYPLNLITSKDIQAWVNTLSNDDGLSGQTVKNIFLNLQAAMKQAKKLKMIAENPCEDIILPRIEKYEAQVYDVPQIQEALKLAEGTDMYLLMFLEFMLGLRKGEIAGLMWSDIDFQKGVIHIQRSRVKVDGRVITKAPKSKAGIRDLWPGTHTMLVLSQEYQKYLDKAQSPKFKATGYVICKEDGTPFVPDSIAQKWDRFKVAHNLPDIRFHDLRHTCATTMIAHGVDTKTVQTRLGHSDVHVTLNTYSHCLPSMNQAAGETMDLILK